MQGGRAFERDGITAQLRVDDVERGGETFAVAAFVEKQVFFRIPQIRVQREVLPLGELQLHPLLAQQQADLALNVETLVPAIEEFFNVQFLAPDVYYISKLPSDVQLKDVTIIAIFAFLITVAFALIPASRAARVQPAEALRYE